MREGEELSLKRIVRLVAGEEVPDGAKHLYSEREKIPTHRTKHYDFGFFSSYVTTRQHYKVETAHYYEVEEALAELEK